MWLFIFFDLPTNTKKERKAASDFRKNLLKNGFIMKQFSVYIRDCPSKQLADLHKRRIDKLIPPKGLVSILMVTDKQFSLIKNYVGKLPSPNEQKRPQLELF